MRQGNPKQEITYGSHTGHTRPLSILELKVVLGLAQGLTLPEIAQAHDTSPATVTDAMYRAMKRLNVQQVCQLSATAEAKDYIWRTSDRPATSTRGRPSLLSVPWTPCPADYFEQEQSV